MVEILTNRNALTGNLLSIKIFMGLLGRKLRRVHVEVECPIYRVCSESAVSSLARFFEIVVVAYWREECLFLKFSCRLKCIDLCF